MSRAPWKKRLPALVLAVVLLSVWEILVAAGAINRALFPAPSAVLLTILRKPALLAHAASSTARMLAAVAVGASVGFLAGLAIGLGRGGVEGRVLEHAVSFFMSIPGMAWAPIFLTITGLGVATIIAVASLTAFFPMVFHTYHGLLALDRHMLQTADLMEFGFLRTLFRVRLPGILTHVFVGLKLSMSRAFMTVVAVEMVSATLSGLGYAIFDARELLNTKTMFAGILLSGAAYLLMEGIVVGIPERATTRRWGLRPES